MAGFATLNVVGRLLRFVLGVVATSGLVVLGTLSSRRVVRTVLA